jgi:methylenetetrahydrofolate reductase (NADPH)
VEAGVDFLQTQPIFDLDVFDAWWTELDKLGLHQKVKILPGILPPRSLKGLQFMMQHVPGIWVPPSVVKRIEAASEQKEEAIIMSLETMQTIKQKYPIAGFHLYPLAWTETVPRMLKDLNLLPRAE